MSKEKIKLPMRIEKYSPNKWAVFAFMPHWNGNRIENKKIVLFVADTEKECEDFLKDG